MGTTILVVDDEPVIHQVMTLILQREGYTTLTAVNATEALHLVYSHRPDLIILDEMMPGMNGSELCLKMKSDSQIAHIPIIMCSSAAQVRNPAFVASIGADAALIKPFKPDQVLDTIAQLLPTRV